AATLSHGVPVDPRMFAQMLPGGIHDLTALRQFLRPALVLEITVDKLRILPIRNKTDLLRFLLLGDSEVRAACELPHLALEHLSKREICTRKLVLRQLPHKIALVLPVIPATKKAIASSRLIVLDASIMSRCDLVAPQRLGHPVQRGKLKPGITRDARYRRLAMQITLNKRLDHIAVKILFEIENIERKPERICHTPCVVDIV